MKPANTVPARARFTMSAHARARVRQRGYREDDIQLVLAHGTDGDEAVVLTDADAEREIEQLKHRIHRLERLRGTAVIFSDATVVSVYRPDRLRLRRLLGR